MPFRRASSVFGLRVCLVHNVNHPSHTPRHLFSQRHFPPRLANRVHPNFSFSPFCFTAICPAAHRYAPLRTFGGLRRPHSLSLQTITFTLHVHPSPFSPPPAHLQTQAGLVLAASLGSTSVAANRKTARTTTAAKTTAAKKKKAIGLTPGALAEFLEIAVPERCARDPRCSKKTRHPARCKLDLPGNLVRQREQEILAQNDRERQMLQQQKRSRKNKTGEGGEGGFQQCPRNPLYVPVCVCVCVCVW